MNEPVIIRNKCPRSSLYGDVHDGPELALASSPEDPTNVVTRLTPPYYFEELQGKLHVCVFCACVFFKETE